MVLQESVTKISWKDSLHKRESAISHGSRRPQTETAGAHQWGKPVVSSRQRGIKPQRRNAGGRESEQHSYHPQPKPSSVQSAVECVHQESVSTATSERTRFDHQPPQKSSSARNEPYIYYNYYYYSPDVILCGWLCSKHQLTYYYYYYYYYHYYYYYYYYCLPSTPLILRRPRDSGVGLSSRPHYSHTYSPHWARIHVTGSATLPDPRWRHGVLSEARVAAPGTVHGSEEGAGATVWGGRGRGIWWHVACPCPLSDGKRADIRERLSYNTRWGYKTNSLISNICDRSDCQACEKMKTKPDKRLM